MKKLFLIIMFLVVLICFSFVYLKYIQKNRHPFLFEEGNTSFLYQKNEILLNNKEDFVFDDFFSFIGNHRDDYRYSFKDENIIISIDEQTFTFPYQIREPQKEIIEKIVIKEVYKEKAENHSGNRTDSHRQETSREYFNVKNSHLTFNEGTDLSTIIKHISDAVESSEKILIDYSILNPNEKGIYAVYLSSGNHSAAITVEIV